MKFPPKPFNIWRDRDVLCLMSLFETLSLRDVKERACRVALAGGMPTVGERLDLNLNLSLQQIADLSEALDITTVTWTVVPVAAGTRLKMVHAGFKLPANQAAFDAMSPGWGHVLQAVERVAAALEARS